MLKPQDMLVGLSLVVEGPLGYERLSHATGLALSQAHQSVQRLKASRLVDADREVNRANFEEFLVHGVPYCWPGELSSGPVNGMPTAGAAPALADRFPAPDMAPRVWPTEEGLVRGLGLVPLYPSVPDAAARSPRLYKLLALVDALRVGAARDKNLAAAELAAELRQR